MSAGRGAPVDPLRKATLRYRQHGVGIELEVLEGTFASAGVDAGTRHLLRWLADERYAGVRSVLDLGCGYGPLALWLAAADPARRILAVDRDARALEATTLGVAGNGTAGVEVRASLGYDDVGPDPVELVVSNVPAKIGSAALRHVVLDAHHHLVPGGRVALVVVERLAEEVGELLADEAVALHAARPNRAYVSFEYSFEGAPHGTSAEPGFGRGLYHRGRGTFRAGSLQWEAAVAHSIAEFDELGHGTVAALELLGRPPSGPVVIEGVGQGHLPLAVRAGGHTGALHLVDRDLLALRVAAANLGDGGATAHHEARLPAALVADADLTIVGLPEREPVAVTAAVAGSALAGAGGRVLLHGRTADVNRVLELLRRHGARLGVDREARVHGHRAVLARRR